MILIDDRSGSGTDRKSKFTKKYLDLINYPPLNICTDPDCNLPFEWVSGEWVCPSGDLSHSSLATLCRLTSGDVSIPGNGPNGPLLIGIEVKSLSDLLSSSDSGRLQATQVTSMLGNGTSDFPPDYDICWLLYHGTYRPNPKTGALQILKGRGKGKPVWEDYLLGSRVIDWGYLESFILSLTTIGVNVKHVYDMAEAALWVSTVAHWWGKQWKDHKSLRTLDSTTTRLPLMPGYSKHEIKLATTAASLPNIKFERGVAAAQHFTSIRSMINADESEWASIPGFGKTIAKTIVDYVTEEE